LHEPSLRSNGHPCPRCGALHTCGLGDARSSRDWFACLTCHFVWSHVGRAGTESRSRAHQTITDVLIVDGDNVSLDLLQRALRGFTVATARDGVDGLARARRCRPAVLIADDGLTGLSGSDVIETIRRERPDITGVLLTRAADRVTGDAALDPQVHALPKRVAVQELRRLITTFIGLPRGRRRG
jgi:CheY-like chemotaxis protein